MGRKSLPKNEMADASNEFEGLYKANQPLIYRFMFWRTKDEMLAQDLTGNVFEKAWRTRASFTGGSGRAWLFRIARTTLIDHWRKAKDISADEHMMDQVESAEPPVEEVLDRQLLVASLQTAVARLPDGMRRVVELRFIQGKSARETGRLLHLSEANVRVVQYRALQNLRKYLQ